MQVSKIYTHVEPKVSVTLKWNLVNKPSIYVTSKRVLNNFTKAIFS